LEASKTAPVLILEGSSSSSHLEIINLSLRAADELSRRAHSLLWKFIYIESNGDRMRERSPEKFLILSLIYADLASKEREMPTRVMSMLQRAPFWNFMNKLLEY
jgi:hypothetical protein